MTAYPPGLVQKPKENLYTPGLVQKPKDNLRPKVASTTYCTRSKHTNY